MINGCLDFTKTVNTYYSILSIPRITKLLRGINVQLQNISSGDAKVRKFTQFYMFALSSHQKGELILRITKANVFSPVSEEVAKYPVFREKEEYDLALAEQDPKDVRLSSTLQAIGDSKGRKEKSQKASK